MALWAILSFAKATNHYECEVVTTRSVLTTRSVDGFPMKTKLICLLLGVQQLKLVGPDPHLLVRSAMS